ncbi:hypothetical protein B296_00001685 [Ensete ventricosum]|uniref:Uncharacterized protein n=1 Tax=Ensete ventricosum TaxID=4639 RepID=A0A427AD89_ENSVE|nr:hypothetical protein B296_00001685 [Ensete ventricosum]
MHHYTSITRHDIVGPVDISTLPHLQALVPTSGYGRRRSPLHGALAMGSHPCRRPTHSDTPPITAQNS